MNDDPRRRFEVGACLGRGGYGEVYRASMRSPGGLATPVALKLVRTDLDVAPEALARLRDEARLLARLQHPNVVRLLDLCSLSGPDGAPRIALVTELVDGRDLAGFVGGPDPLPPRAALEVGAAVAGALTAAWETPGPDGRPLHVVHRDVKPSNVAIGRHGEVRVLDFGIASFEGEEREARTATAMLVGSLPYLAPERFLARASDPAADVFAVGAVLFELLAGEAWFAGIPPRRLPGLAADRDRYEAWRWERLQRIGDASLRDALAPTLAWDPAARPTGAVLARSLEDLAGGMTGRTLRAWCRERTWDGVPKVPGALEGLVLVEAGDGVPPPAAPPSAAPKGASTGPRMIRAPLPTVNSAGDPVLEEKLQQIQGSPKVISEGPRAPAPVQRVVTAPSRRWPVGCALIALVAVGSSVAVVLLLALLGALARLG